MVLSSGLLPVYIIMTIENKKGKKKGIGQRAKGIAHRAERKGHRAKSRGHRGEKRRIVR